MEKTESIKKDIIKRLFEKGILLSPQELENINSDTIQQHRKEKKEQTSKIKVTLFPIKTKEKVTIKDITNYKNKKYMYIKETLSKKTNPLSINKTKKNFSEVYVIGMIKEMTSSGFIIEDPTDEIEIISEKTENLNIDDVISIKGIVRENKLFSTEILFPDIPLNRPIPQEKGIFVFSHKTTDSIANENPDIVFFLDTNEAENKNIIKITTNPFRIEIKNKETINILVYNPPEKTKTTDAINLLRKRHLSPHENQIPLNNDPFFIKTIPDIFWIISDENWKENYKGVTLFSCSKKNFAKINLETREVEFKSL